MVLIHNAVFKIWGADGRPRLAVDLHVIVSVDLDFLHTVSRPRAIILSLDLDILHSDSRPRHRQSY